MPSRKSETPDSHRHRLILASASPRRRELLAQIGITPDAIDAAEIDETERKNELPADLVRRLALEKLNSIKARHEDAFVLAADTVVACGRRHLAKPADEAEARAFLTLLSGRRHQVHTAIAGASPAGVIGRRLVTTVVKFKRLSEYEVDRYMATSEWQGKAGGYAIQGRAAAFIPWIRGSYSNVVGLPLAESASLLRGLGFD